MKQLSHLIVVLIVLGITFGSSAQEVVLSTDSIPLPYLDIDSLSVIEVRMSSELPLGLDLNQRRGSQLDISENQALDVGRLMQAKSSGLSISNNSYSPGASTRMLFRGQRSILGSHEPQIFLDGIPLNNDEWNNGLSGTDQSNRLMDIDPKSIESINIIKSSAARAKYGIVGANGVIHIKTKRGAHQKPRISYAATLGLDQVSQLPALQSTFAQGRNLNSVSFYRGPETGERFSWGPRIDDLSYEADPDYPFDVNGRLTDFDQGGNSANKYDPYSFFKKGQFSNHTLSVTGGSDKIQYRAQGSASSQKGVMPTTSNDRFNFSGALSSSVTERLSVIINAQVSTNQTVRNQKGSNLEGVMLGLLRTPFTFDNSNGLSDPASDPDSYTYQNGMHRSSSDGIYTNPYWTLNKNPHKDKVNRQVISMSTEYKLATNLSLAMTVGHDRYVDNRTGGIDVSPSVVSRLGSAYDRTIDFKSQYADLSAQYNFRVGKEWSFTSLLQTNYHRSDSKYDIVEGVGLGFSDDVTIDNLKEVDAYQFNNELERAGALVSLDSEYSDFLKLSGSIRQDYSNKMGASANGFLSYGFGFGLSITDLLQQENPKTDIKFIGSYGVFGNYEGGLGERQNRYVSSVISGDGFISSAPLDNPEMNNVLRSEDLTVEKTRSFDIGVAVGLEIIDVNFIASYYNEYSSGLIIADRIATSSGFDALESNIGAITNKGVEFTLQMTPVEQEYLKWDLNIDFNKNINEVKNIGDSNEEIFLGGFTGNSSVAKPSFAYGSISGSSILRNGNDQIIVDYLGYPLRTSSDQIIANPNPDWVMYLSNSLMIGKALSLNILFDIKKGGEMYCGTCATLDFLGKSQLSADERGISKIFEGVTTAGEINTTVVELAPYSGSDFQYFRVRYGFSGITEFNIFDAGWVRLRSLSCNYDLSSLVSNCFLRDISIGLFAENLFVISNYPGIDPETNLTGNSGGIGIEYYNNPGSKRYGLKLKASF